MTELMHLQHTVEQLRADLTATHAALAAVLTSLPTPQQRQALNALAQGCIQQERQAALASTPEAKRAAQQVMVATERLFEALQHAHRQGPGQP